MLGKAIAFCGGTAAIQLLPSAGAASVAAVPAVAAACLIRHRPALAAFLAGCAVGVHGAAATMEKTWPCARDREVVELEVRIAGPAVVRPDRTEFDVDVTPAPGLPAGLGRVRLSWYDARALPRAGERWRLGARLRCPRGFANPGAPDRELALLREGIDATGYVTGTREPERLAAGSTERIERLRERVARSIIRALDPGASAAVLQGLAVGLRANVPDRVWEALAATGLAHLVAISGLHVTGCALAVLVLLRSTWHRRLLPATRWRPAVEATTVIVVTSAYALLSGASLPALRTVAMVGLFHALRSLRRSVSAGEALALAAAVLIAADPLAVSSAGFWLSFVATAGLLAAGPAAPGWRGHVGQFARAQAAVTLVLAPVLAATFGRLSLVAPFLNAIAIPAFSLLLLPAVLVGTLLALASPDAPALLWQLLAAALDALWPELERIAGWPAASFAPAAQSIVVIAGAGILVLAALMVPLTGLRVVACVALVALACGRGTPVPQGGFTLTVLDVGQGQAAVVETAAHVLLFDTGPRWRGGLVAARVSLLPFLRDRGIRKIDRLVVSHEDADHAGGAEVIEQAFVVALRIEAPGGRNAAATTCVAGDGWDWDGIAFRVLHPPAGFEGDDNERSCAIHVRGAGGSALLLADPEAAAEAALAQLPIAADIVLIPHHGSRTSSSPELVAAVSARIGIVSAGFGNRWDLPRTEVVERWRAAGATVLNTAGQGAVRVRFAPSDAPLEIEGVRRDEPRWWRAGSGRRGSTGSPGGRTVSSRAMWEIILAGGPVMWPIILCSVVAAAIVFERLWTLQRKRVIPRELTDRIWKLVESQTLNERHIEALAHNSPLGRVLAAGLANRDQGREIMKEAIEDTGRHVVHELERFLGTLGTIAAVSPLLGLLGTVTGMIQAFEAISAEGVGDPQVLAGGIGTALITTAAGLIVAIPALFCYRYLRGVVDLLVVDMEKEAMKLVRAFDQLEKRADRGSRRREAAS